MQYWEQDQRLRSDAGALKKKGRNHIHSKKEPAHVFGRKKRLEFTISRGGRKRSSFEVEKEK